jgi:hypothetical protein
MRWYLDTEFLEDGKTIELISIALVAEDRALPEYYAGNAECDIDRVRRDPWLSQHVTQHLPPFGPGAPSMPSTFWKSRLQIATDILCLFGIVRGSPSPAHGVPEIWADFSSYDWVALCQIYGRTIDLPSGMPMFCFDLQQDLRARGIHRSELPRQDPKTEHNAHGDARWLRRAHLFAQGIRR